MDTNCTGPDAVQGNQSQYVVIRSHTGLHVVQGTHTAMKSGMLAAQAAFSALTPAPTTSTFSVASSSAARQAPVDISSYQKAMEDSYVWDELRDSRNIRPG